MADNPFQGGDLDKLLKQAQEMQEKFQDAQNDLVKIKVEGQAGSGAVKINMNGKHEVSNVSIQETMLDDQEMVEDLVAAAINDAVRKVEEESKKLLETLTAGMDLPPTE